jgi:16S rRNA (guanine1207-N2)-methyltransferase
LSPLARLFLRQQDSLTALKPRLWLLPPADLPGALVQGAGSGLCFVQDDRDRASLEASGLTTRFGAFPVAGDFVAPGNAVLCLPREKARFQMLAHALAAAMDPDRVLWVAGEIRAGAKSAIRQLKPWFGQVRKLDAARHCVLFEASLPHATSPFSLADYDVSWTLDAFGRTLRIHSYPGVFSHGELDEGSRLLLDCLPAVLEKAAPSTALDLGCGTGVLGAALLAACPGVALTLVDSQALALEAARRTLSANGFSARTLPSDGLRAVDGRFDLIISNPPFHVDHRERSDLGAGLFRGARNFLNPGGQVVIVANRHLPWPATLDREFGRHEVLAATNRFHVLRAPAGSMKRPSSAVRMDASTT